MNRNASGSFSSKLAHAQSTPAGVDGSGMSFAKTPPTTPKRGGKMISVRVQMLDDSITVFQVQAKAIGRLLFDQVCKQLNLLEADYFGLEYQDSTTKYWLDLEKPIQRQLGLSLVDPLLRFCVKFYTPDPAQIEEEYTRYLFCLQLKRDLMEGDLLCNDNTAALIISYIVQAECGDYTSEDYPDHTYLSSHRFVPHQDRESERKIMENHKKHVGQTPAEADLNLLETARRCELYGMKMHLAKDQEGVPLNLAVAHMGIVVFQNSTKINTFSWAKIRKISFKRKRFLIKLHPEGYGYYKDVVEFIFDNRNQCKSFWKKCVENHGFFRCSYVQSVPRQRARVLSRGSSSFRSNQSFQSRTHSMTVQAYYVRPKQERQSTIRITRQGANQNPYSGKTQKQMIEYVRENYVRRQTFQRSQSFRHQSSTHSSVVNVGASSISAHPLLPLGENAIAGSGASLSCGSMTLSGSLSPTIPPEGGPPTVPTALNHQQSQQQQLQQQTPADIHEPVTTCSDITSIASQSPPHDTGQTHHYPSQMSRVRLCEKLTNTSCPYTTNTTVTTNTLDRQGGPDSNLSAYRDIRYDYDTGKAYTEIRFPTISSSISYSSGAASTVFSNSGVSSTILKTTHGNRASINDPDIIRDLGKQNWSSDEYAWQRSASCKELGRLQPAVAMERLLKADAVPVTQRSRETTQFDSFGHCYSCHGQSAPFTSVREQTSIETKVYSSSYPGTTPRLSVESDDEPTGIVTGSNVYLMDNNNDPDDGDENYRKISHDDLSHDSYELLEKEEMAMGMSRRSRSSSVDSDEMFVMENDYGSASKHIFWREGSADVEKRLGYVEPRYRNIDFNEFNEICKRGFASRNRNASLSHGNIRFSEFTVGNKLEKVIPAHENVARTKSDPYMIRSSLHSSNRQKLFGVHQKSFDLAPSECYSGGGGSSDDGKYTTGSKSAVDIPYTLRIRNAMNGTAREYTASTDNGYNFGSSVGAGQSRNTGTKCAMDSDIRLKGHGSDYTASQDSGLSLSLGTESVDDIDIDLKNVMLAKNSYEQVITSKKSTKLMLSLSEENNENMATVEEAAAPFKEKGVAYEASKAQLLTNELKTEEKGDNKHIIKVKSVEVPKKSHSSGGGRVRKSRSAEACDCKSSFLRTDSGGSRGKKEIIVIDSDDYHSFDDSRSDRRSDGSDSVIIVEYRGNKKKRLSKKASSDSRGSQAESEASSFDAPRIKKKELKKRHSAHAAYFYKDRIPTIEISEDETYKADTGAPSSGSATNFQYGLSAEYSSDERHASGSDLSKTEAINELIEDDVQGCCVLTECGTSQEQCDDLAAEDEEDGVESEESTLVGTAVTALVTSSNSGRFSLVNKTLPMLTRLGLSEGSATFHLDQKSLPLSVARRAKSLDTPIVSLHRLPPITSFSSKDDTVDSEEIVAVLEEKMGKCSNNQTSSTHSEECVAEEHPVEETPFVAESLTTLKPELKPKPMFIRSVSAAVTAFSTRKQSLDLRAFTKNDTNDNDVIAELGIVNKERSKSEGYDRNIELSKDLSCDRKQSTRQERLDSFKKLKNFSIELWESEEVDGKSKKVETTNSKEFDDNVFEESIKLVGVEVGLVALRREDEEGIIIADPETNNVTSSSSGLTTSEKTISTEKIEQEVKSVLPLSPVTAIDKKSSLRLELVDSDKMSFSSAQKVIPEKRSFDDEPSTSLSMKPEPLKTAGLESSGSSSVEEGILPCDCGDDEELAQLPSEAAAHASLDASLTLDAFTNPLSSPFNPGFFSLARTLSRISERSTTSEQERITDVDDDSTKPLSRSLSIDDSILSSDQHLSFSSDPPSGMNLENVFDDDDAAPLVELDEDKLDFNIPPPLLSPTEPVDDDWPSPPCSPGSVKTPVIDGENFSAAGTTIVVQTNSPPIIEVEGEEEAGSVSEDNKTLQEEDDGSELDDGRMYRKERTRGSIGDDTSAGLTTSDWSSSTGTTIKQANTTGGATTTAPSTASKSEDNSFAGECGLISLTTDTPTTPMMASGDPSRQSSVDELAGTSAMPFEKKYLTLDRKQTSADRKLVFFPPTFDSFDDEYDSPCTESEDTPSSPMPPYLFRRQRPPAPQDQSDEQPPPPPRHFQDVTTTASSAVLGSGASGGGVSGPSGGGAVIQKWRTKTERNRATKFAMPHYTSSSMSTSVESPTSAERKFAKMVAKAKCYSYYSLARSPPSDGSSSSPDAPETPLTPNTIPRVSKRRRVVAHSSARRRAPQQRLTSDEHHRGSDHYVHQHSHHHHPHHHSASPSILVSSGYKSFHHSRKSRYQGIRTPIDENINKVKNAS